MSASLILLNEHGPVTYALQPGVEVTLGRDKKATVYLDDDTCSRRHAVIYEQAGRWFVRDLGSQNGTYVDLRRVEKAPLSNGQTILLGNKQLQFVLHEDAREGSDAASTDHRDRGESISTSGLLNQSQFQPDELTALCCLMADGVETSDDRRLLETALETVRRQTGADVVGFLSLDEAGDLLPRLVLPDLARVNLELSRSLTAAVQQSRRPIWLQRDRPQGSGESLVGFEDAICVPLDGGGTLLGALHAYRKARSFTAAHTRFCEIVGRHLAGVLRVGRLRRQLEAENSRLRHQLPPADDLIGSSPAMQRVRQMIARVASRPSTVLIRGESGVGKERVARAIHRLSSRRDGPLEVLNCATVPENLVESQLFGHKKGAFSDAVSDYDGCFRRADGGTLFLDEIGEFRANSQAALLRVIEDKKVMPLGGQEPVVVDVRVIAATNRDLEREVQEGRFRQDLYYRLHVLEIAIPPLRERVSDIPELAEHFLKYLAQQHGRAVRLTSAAWDRLVAHSWPGNVRELQNVLESALTFVDGDTIDADDLPIRGHRPAKAAGGLPTLNLRELEKLALAEAWRRTGGDANATAALLGLSRSTIYEKAKRYGVPLD
jgi:Nif-specific regulatory protein